MKSDCCATPWPAAILCGHGQMVVACINCGSGQHYGDHTHQDG